MTDVDAKEERRGAVERLSLRFCRCLKHVQGCSRPDFTAMLCRLGEESGDESGAEGPAFDCFKLAGDLAVRLCRSCAGGRSNHSLQILAMELGLCEVKTVECLEDRLRRAGIALDAICSLNDSSIDEARCIGFVRSLVQDRVAIMEAELSGDRHWECCCGNEFEKLGEVGVFEAQVEVECDSGERHSIFVVR